jgi:hypothetical protein
MALDLNIPPPEAGEDDPFGGFPHVQDHPPPVGAPSFDTGMATNKSA